ncbi:signal peptidase II [Sphingomonas sp. BN140010]|uniref:Lipoprotein signal peptidase n=1 Tax=Sphingomonas arvum TaxID=2992113 RepID=A0ABT3JBL7_9SPHN|nr:signal peptidase II [Sphingomonas sp. BN140010]MCW3796460.1 signal peptidase II [Sphingomonas sp. BN140010]
MSRARFGLLTAALVFIADQLTKWLVAGPFGLRAEGDRLDLLPIFDLMRVHNHGISLGLLTASTDTYRWLLVAFTAAIAMVVAYWLFREPKKGDQLALGMVLGGALGNIVDRVRFGYVLDFADLHFGSWRPFLVFNVADAAISIGVVILILRALFVKDSASREKVQNA